MIFIATASRQMQKLDGVSGAHRWEHLEEFFDRKAVIEVVKQRLGGNSRASEYESASHEFGVRMDRAAFERWHFLQCRHSGGPVNSDCFP
jgi:hypothetical protein